MNKTKIMLSAIAAISAVGGAFALKSKKLGCKTVYVSQLNTDPGAPIPPAGQQYCTITLQHDATAYEVRPSGSLSSFSYFYVTETPPIGTAADLCTYKYYTTCS
jgi:hypothetical protein